MKQSFKAIGLFAYSLILVIMSGCTTQISGLKVDPSFTYPAAVSGHIAVVGVVSSAGTLTPADTATYSNQLKFQLSEIRPDFILISYGEVINQLGQEAHAKLLNELQTMGTPSNSSMDMLRKKSSGYRYIAYCRIESDSIQKILLPASNSNQKLVYPATERNVTGSLQVVDISDGKNAWSATATTKIRNLSFPVAPPEEDQEDRNPTFRKALEKAAIDSLLGKTEYKFEYTYPPEPTLIKALNDLFESFSKNMPKK